MACLYCLSGNLISNCLSWAAGERSTLMFPGLASNRGAILFKNTITKEEDANEKRREDKSEAAYWGTATWSTTTEQSEMVKIMALESEMIMMI